MTEFTTLSPEQAALGWMTRADIAEVDNRKLREALTAMRRKLAFGDWYQSGRADAEDLMNDFNALLPKASEQSTGYGKPMNTLTSERICGQSGKKFHDCICFQDENHLNCPAIKKGTCHFQSLYSEDKSLKHILDLEKTLRQICADVIAEANDGIRYIVKGNNANSAIIFRNILVHLAALEAILREQF